MPDITDICPQGLRYERLERVLELPMVGLAVAFVAAIIVQDLKTTSEAYRETARVAEWVVWGFFVAEYCTLFALAANRRLYIRTHLIDLVVIVLPALRVVRALRILRLLRIIQVLSVASFQWQEIRRITARRGIGIILAGVATVILAGAYLIYCAEGTTNPQFASYGASVWWAIVTATTVGYGDAAPQTCEGRIIAVAFMLAGICLFGVVSATLAAYFVDSDQQASQRELLVRLAAIERKLDELDRKR